MAEQTGTDQREDSVPQARQQASGSKDPHESWGGDERLRFESMLASLSARFVSVSAEALDAEIENAQKLVCEGLGLDLSALWQEDADHPGTFILTHIYRPLGGPPIPERMEGAEHWPWALEMALAGKIVTLCSTEDAPPEAAVDLAGWRHYGIKAVLTTPLATADNPVFGILSFADMRAEREWSEPLVNRLELVAQIFANAINRMLFERALRDSEARLSLATEAAGAGPWVLDAQAGRFWAGPKIFELLGLPPGDSLEMERFIGLVHPEDRESVRDITEQALQSRELTIVEYRIVRPDGQVRWMQSRGRVTAGDTSDTARLTGMTADITERRRTEDNLRQALDEVQRLRDQLQRENVYLRERIRTSTSHETIIGESAPVQKMLAMARQVAPTDSAVLITGDTGTGKELLAQTIHDLSPRGNKLMVKVNCAALPAPLIESELFGREKGAYTGAMSRQAGRFEIANGSTIFLDEIGDLPLDLQAKLLRVLQDGRFERLGGIRTFSTDARVVAATNHDLAAMMRHGDFREDLFHRLNVFPIEVPPLSARAADIPLLVWKIVEEFNKKMGRSIDTIPKPTMERLKKHSWPGNVRELRNIIERAMIVSEGRSLSVVIPDAEGSLSSAASTLADVERRHICDVLERVHWRISGKGGAAEILGLAPTTLHSRMKKLGLARPKP
jgi:formate hydrogenlyase transcriptional activator